MTVDTDQILRRARGSDDDLVAAMLALLTASNSVRDAWARRSKDAEERAIAAESECRCLAAQVEELRARLACFESGTDRYITTAVDRVRRERDARTPEPHTYVAPPTASTGPMALLPRG